MRNWNAMLPSLLGLVLASSPAWAHPPLTQLDDRLSDAAAQRGTKGRVLLKGVMGELERQGGVMRLEAELPGAARMFHAAQAGAKSVSEYGRDTIDGFKVMRMKDWLIVSKDGGSRGYALEGDRVVRHDFSTRDVFSNANEARVLTWSLHNHTIGLRVERGDPNKTVHHEFKNGELTKSTLIRASHTGGGTRFASRTGARWQVTR
jgi:hypothetical protein